MDKRKVTFFIQVIVAFAVVVGITALLVLDTSGDAGNKLGEDFQYDISELKKIDPELITYYQVGDAIKTGFEESRAIAVDNDGTVYVAGDNSIKVFEDGELVNEIPVVSRPQCVTVTDESVYVGTNSEIVIFDKSGTETKKWQMGGGNRVVRSIAVYKDNVFIADAKNRVVLWYDAEGNLVNRIGEKDESRNVDGFVVPSPYFDLTVGSDGLLRVVNPGNHRIDAFTFDGDLEFSWGAFGNLDIDRFCGCCNPTNFAILGNDDFVTCEKGLVRVKIYDAEGKFKSVVAGSEQFGDDSAVLDAAVDGDGKIYVLDMTNNLLRFFAEK